MDQQILDQILQLLDQYGILGAVIIALGVLVFKYADQLIKVSAANLAEGKKTFLFKARKVRKDSAFKVNRLLTELLQKTSADRVALFEYHNGGYNLTGMPFLHFSLSICRNNYGVDDLSKDFNDILVSSVPDFVKELDDNEIVFLQDIDPLKGTFPRLYKELLEDGIKQVIFCNIEGIDDPVGILMLTFKTVDINLTRKVRKEVFKKVQKISTLLDYKNI